MASSRKRSLLKKLDETPIVPNPEVCAAANLEMVAPFVQVTIYAERVVINQVPATKRSKREPPAAP